MGLSFDFLLLDRIEKIRSVDRQFDLSKNSYVSFSGGKDSTILHYLIDLALPDNNIPRVFVNTGIEFKMIQTFVTELANKDKRFFVLNPKIPIKPTLQKYGYPFKSKDFSEKLSRFQKDGMKPYLIEFYNNSGKFGCPKKLQYLFQSQSYPLKISDSCCIEMKKKPLLEFSVLHNKPIAITGIRNSEGGRRSSLHNCIITDNNGSLKKFHPLLVVDDNFENAFIDKYKIRLCELYYEPYNFSRTGCVGCPFNIELQDELETLFIKLPNEYKLAESVWKPVYEEYRKIDYRLKDYLQPKIWSL